MYWLYYPIIKSDIYKKDFNNGTCISYRVAYLLTGNVFTMFSTLQHKYSTGRISKYLYKGIEQNTKMLIRNQLIAR